MNSPVKYHYDRFPPSDLDWQQLIPLIGLANAALEAVTEQAKQNQKKATEILGSNEE
ncbi:hypothetical protein CKA32_001158 [Geitlerinema sp. FC II]|nr:hypothetical protein [Geitlerinema sp. CS-897]PPT10792.1 hypothetical protein CKA32_001158 [Geitlerinema sp. FC II]